MMGVFAEFERAIIQERVPADLRRAKDEDKTLGRLGSPPELEARIRAALNEPGRIAKARWKLPFTPWAQMRSGGTPNLRSLLEA